LVRKNLGESDHAKEIPHRESAAKLRDQLCTQCVHYLFSILGPFFLQDILPNAPPHVPVQSSKPGIHRLRHFGAGLHNQLPYIGQQRPLRRQG
jgi:hypothetical protein